MSPFLQGCKCSELQFLLCSWAVVPSNAAGCLPCCPSQGVLVDASHMSGWSTAESSRHLSVFALDSPLHTPSLLQAITLCSTAASTLFFPQRPWVCLKSLGLPCKGTGAKRELKPSMNLGTPGQRGSFCPSRDIRGMAMIKQGKLVRLLWLKGAAVGCWLGAGGGGGLTEL